MYWFCVCPVFANWLAAQTEGEDSDRERECSARTRWENVIDIGFIATSSSALLSNGDSAQPAVTFVSQTKIVWFRAQIVVLDIAYYDHIMAIQCQWTLDFSVNFERKLGIFNDKDGDEGFSCLSCSVSCFPRTKEMYFSVIAGIKGSSSGSVFDKISRSPLVYISNSGVGQTGLIRWRLKHVTPFLLCFCNRRIFAPRAVRVFLYLKQ